NRDQRQKILVDEMAGAGNIITIKEINEATASHRKSKRRKRGKDERDERSDHHGFIATHIGRELEDRTNGFGRFTALSLFFDGFDGGIRGFAHMDQLFLEGQWAVL